MMKIINLAFRLINQKGISEAPEKNADGTK